MKKELKFILQKTIAVGTLVLLLLQQSSFVSFAQTTASSSGETNAISIGSPSAILLPQDAASQAAFLGINNLTTNPSPSASVAQPAVVNKLPKKSYKADEQVALTIGNSQKDTVSVQVIDSYGLDATNNFVIQKFVSGTNTIVDIIPPQSRFKPGKYSVKITDSSGSATTQDFTWGVLAINTNKSIYLPSETADIAMAVLDETGNMVCDAAVTLTITDPQNHVTTLSTAKGDILVNDICTKHEFSLTPDYETAYTVGGAGQYTMDLSATTDNGTYTITDSFSVQNSVDFDVSRTSATRLYPPVWYPMTLPVKANKDFSGVVTDYVPATFDVTPATQSGVISYSDVKTVYPGSENTASLFGTASLKLFLPFSGVHAVEQGFGEQLTDPEEKAEYAQYHVLGHDGIDFAMPIGTPVLATDDGVVVLASKNSDYGTTIVIRHSWGQSYYGHLSTMEVSVGDHVSRGQEIAKSGNTGLSTGAHLHFGIKPKNPEIDNGFFGKVDPAPYLPLDQSDAASWNVSTRLGNQPLKVVQWKVDLKKGDTVTLGYQFKAPNVSPEFYTLGPLHFIDHTGSVVFSEARTWQLAADATFPATSYLSATTGSLITSVISRKIVTVAPASSDVLTTISDSSNKVAGYTQWQPGVVDATKAGSAPTTPNGKGYIYETPLDSTIPAGNWTFNIQTNISTAVTSGTMNVTVCIWKVTVSGGVITGSSQIATCTDGTTNVYTPSGALNSSVVFTSLPAQSFSASQYLYVEYWAHNAGTGGGKASSATITFQNNAGANNDIVLAGGASSNLSPNTPTQSSPSNGATGVSTTPAFSMNAADPESDKLQYKVTLYNGTGCSVLNQTFDQTTSQTGWSGQNATCVSGSDCYTSGSTATYTVQSALSSGTYSWTTAAKDPSTGNSNAFGTASTCWSFTVPGGPTGPTLDQLLRHGEWFSSGVAQPFTF